MQRYGGLPWRVLLVGAPKEGLQRLSEDNGLRSDLSKDELVQQIAGLRSKGAKKDGPLRNWGGRWTR